MKELFAQYGDVVIVVVLSLGILSTFGNLEVGKARGMTEISGRGLMGNIENTVHSEKIYLGQNTKEALSIRIKPDAEIYAEQWVEVSACFYVENQEHCSWNIIDLRGENAEEIEIRKKEDGVEFFLQEEGIYEITLQAKCPNGKKLCRVISFPVEKRVE